MKKYVFLLGLLTTNLVFAQDENNNQESIDHLKLLADYKAELEKLKSDKESLQKTIKLHEELINSIQNNNAYTTNTKWNTIVGNVTNGVESYRLLNDKIQLLKTVSKTASYISFTNSLSGISDNPLGFSFEEKMLNSYKSNFTDKKKQSKFTQIIQSITTSPLVQLVPIASQASTITNSVLNILYTNEANNKESELENIKKFENEISKYLKYFNEMSAQNQELNTNNVIYVKGLESLQQDIIKDVIVIREKFGLKVRDRKIDTNDVTNSETVDAYLNYLLDDLNKEFIQSYLSKLKSNYSNNIDKLLQNENSILTLNNNLDKLEDHAAKFKSTYEFYTSFNKSYVVNLTKIINFAKTNNIIENKGNKSAEQIHQEVIQNLNVISNDNLKQLDVTIKLHQLENTMNKVNYIKFL